jgi:hypothetical protein
LNPIVEKIKKLLRMKRGGTPDETATALALAQELAAKHGIDIDKVNPDEQADGDRITDKDALLSSRIQWECKYAALVVQEFFNISFFLKKILWKTSLTFVGTGWEIEIALHVYKFLVAHMRREWRCHRGRCRNRQAFLYGMYHGLCRKLQERKPDEVQERAVLRLQTALEARNQYISRREGELEFHSTVPDGDANKAKYLGLLAGYQTEIYPAVTADAHQKQLPPAS